MDLLNPNLNPTLNPSLNPTLNPNLNPNQTLTSNYVIELQAAFESIENYLAKTTVNLKHLKKLQINKVFF